MIRNLTIGQKVVFSLLAAGAVVIGVVGVGLTRTSAIGEHLESLVDMRFPSATALTEIRSGMDGASRAMNGNLIPEIAASRVDYEPGYQMFDRSFARIEAARAEWRRIPHTKAGDERWAAFQPLYEDWARSMKELFGAIKAYHDAVGRSAAEAEVKEVRARAFTLWRATRQTYVAATKPLDELIVHERERVQEEKEASLANTRSARVGLLVAAAAALLTLAAVALLISRNVRRTFGAITAEAGKLTDAVQRGQLEVRGEAGAVSAEFRGIVEGMNRTVDAFVKPIQLTAGYLTRIARGDLPPKISEAYAGEFDTIKQSINTCIEALNRVTADTHALVQAAVSGRLAARADATRHHGDFRKTIEGINQTISTLVGHLDAMPVPALIIDRQFSIQYINGAGAQVLGRPAERLIGSKCHDCFATSDCHTERCACLRAMSSGRAETSETEAHPNGQSLEITYSGVPVRALDGTIVGAFEVVMDQTAIRKAMVVSRKVAEYQAAEAQRVTAELGKLARGDANLALTVAQGDADTAAAREVFERIAGSIGACADAVKRLVADSQVLSAAAVRGELSSRADTARHEGEFRNVIKGINATLDAVLGPIQEASQVLEKLATRDLTARMEGSYQGDHAKTKEALNATAQALHEAMSQVAEAVSQVSSASSQIAASSQSVADGASEQASSLQETTSSLDSMSTMTRQAADNAQQANGLAQSAKAAATEGGAAMEQMTGAMEKIKAAAEGTSEIIRDINEIAFQTNLLALNAAVEAARAGDAGRGFAVVAEEVRSLALRSKEAAMKTEQLIRESVNQAGEGETTSKHVSAKLGEITGSVTKVTDIIAEIAASAREQAAGIQQVSKAVSEMDRITQQNAANSEESSSAAAELSGQSEELAAMVGTFQLGRGSAPRPAPQAGARPTVAAKPAPARARSGKPGHGAAPRRPEDVIPLSGDARLEDF